MKAEKLKSKALKEMQLLQSGGMENLDFHYVREHDRVCGIIRRANENMKGVKGEPRKQYFKEIDMRKHQERRRLLEISICELRKNGG